MKKVWVLLLVGMLCVSFASQAQESYKTKTDASGNKMLVGKLSLQSLINDSSFTWFYTGINKYQPNKDWVKYIHYYRDSFSVVVFSGTWNKNSQALLPSFYRTMMSAGYPLKNITLYGVDHNLHELGDAAQKYNIHKLPTIIILHDGTELGRITEVPVQSIEANLVSILQTRFVPEQSDSTGVEQ